MLFPVPYWLVEGYGVTLPILIGWEGSCHKILFSDLLAGSGETWCFPWLAGAVMLDMPHSFLIGRAESWDVIVKLCIQVRYFSGMMGGELKNKKYCNPFCDKLIRFICSDLLSLDSLGDWYTFLLVGIMRGNITRYWLCRKEPVTFGTVGCGRENLYFQLQNFWLLTVHPEKA